MIAIFCLPRLNTLLIRIIDFMGSVEWCIQNPASKKLHLRYLQGSECASAAERPLSHILKVSLDFVRNGHVLRPVFKLKPQINCTRN